MTILWYINGVEKHSSCILVRKSTDGAVYAGLLTGHWCSWSSRL